METNWHSMKVFWGEALKVDSLLAWFIFKVTFTRKDYEQYMDLCSRGVELLFLNEPHINPTVYKAALDNQVPMTGTDVDCILEGINKFLMALAASQSRIAFEQSEKEVEDLRQRTIGGIETARQNGKQIGRA